MLSKRGLDSLEKQNSYNFLTNAGASANLYFTGVKVALGAKTIQIDSYDYSVWISEDGQEKKPTFYWGKISCFFRRHLSHNGGSLFSFEFMLCGVFVCVYPLCFIHAWFNQQIYIFSSPANVVLVPWVQALCASIWKCITDICKLPQRIQLPP